MDEKISEVIKTDAGQGKLFEESIFIDDVSYYYKITQEFIVYNTIEGLQKIPGLKDIIGSIHLLNKREDISGKCCILFLSDNTKWNIVVPSGDFFNSNYVFKFAPGNEND